MAKTKVELQNYQGESLSPITIASNVLYEDGRNAQEVFEEYSNETFTPTIENSSSMFKVGQGDNVDYSANVVNGAYESMVLKGKSMVNCIQEPSSKDVVLPYEFEEGRYVTINDTKESGALGVELKGQTLVNLISDITQIKSTATVELIEYSLSPMSFVAKYGNTVSNTSNNRIVIYTPFKERLKLNEDYTIVYDYELLENPDNVDCQIAIAVDMWGQMAESPVIQTKGSKGRVVHRRNRASNNISTTFNFINNQGTNAKWKISNLMLLEGDWTNKEIPPYFEGMASCKMPILRTVGKNLAKFTTDQKEVLLDSTVETTRTLTLDVDELLTIVNKNVGKRICLAYEVETSEETTYGHHSIDLRPEFEDGTAVWWSTTPKRNGTVYKSHMIAQKVKQFLNKEVFFRSAKGTGRIYNVRIWISDTDTDTTYEAHKSSILSLPEEVVLRGIPNRACDTLNTRTGVYIQNCIELIYDGETNSGASISTSVAGTTENTNSFSLHLPSLGLDTAGGICDCLKIVGLDDDEKGIVFGRGGVGKVFIKTDKTIATIAQLKEWLKNNNIRVVVRTTPIVTKINLSSTLKSWNTTTHIYSEIPENTLYPTLSHSNPSYPVILKPSTKYSIVANSYSNDHTNSAINFNLGGVTASTTVGNRVTTITTPSTLSNELLTMSGRGNKLNNVMVIEGDVVGDEPYFEGICDCKSPILSNVGKNLVDSSKIKKWMDRDTHFEYPDWIRVKPNTRYITNLEMGCWELFNANKKKIGENFGPEASPNIRSKLMPSDCYYVKARCWGGNADTDNGLEYYQKNFVLCEETVITSQEPYKSNTTTFEQKDGKTIVLRSLPNGVCDTLNVETGEYVQRIGEVVLDGSWGVPSQELNGYFISYYGLNDVKKENGGNVYCDKFASHGQIWAGGREGVSTFSNSTIWLSISSSKLETPDINGMKKWLSQNPTTVQYELATPIVSTIDVQGFPYAYENGHVQLSSGHNAQSLTPKVEYSVATNRNGQIRSNQKMVERHQKQLDQLQAIILANMVNTQYQQTLTTLNYDLLKKEVGE